MKRMRNARFCWIWLWFWAVGQCLAAQRPPNDDFANRTLLTGSSLIITGSLAGATYELPLEVSCAQPYGIFGLRSIWYSWTAEATTPVVIQVLEINGTSSACDGGNCSGLCVFEPTDLTLGFPTNDRPSSIASLHFDLQGSWLSFTAQAGHTYQIKAGDDRRDQQEVSYKFQLTATANPVIMSPPKSVTLSEGQAALFTVHAAGGLPLKYQWYFNGTALPGANFSLLALTNVASAQVGEYSVVVSNATGASLSRAFLNLSSNEAYPEL